MPTRQPPASARDSTFEEPIQASCVKGEVVITGPAHMHGAFSAKAAHESAALLEALADQAQAAGEKPHSDPED